ncbi:MAG: CRISPR-associated endonuclease Cas2 [Candidatus Vogelbacteria bacterium]|nr:CRISPR-associated endonuclease Cas2 [Candidatus Vogelbacteria bacterium]
MPRNKQTITSPTKQKVLLLLAAGAIIGLSSSPAMPKRVFRMVKRAWRDIDRQYLYRIISEFYHDRLVDYQEKKDGTIDIVLTEAGRKKTISFKVDSMTINKPKQWDKKWRIVFFDIPERKKAARHALRHKLKELGFKNLQRSVFVCPYPCEDEINFIVEFFEVRPYVRYSEVTKLTNDADLKLYFELI